MEQMSSYHDLNVWWLKVMSDCIDQESAYKKNPSNLQQTKHKPDRNNEDFDNLCDKETPYAQEYTNIPVPDQTPCQ